MITIISGSNRAGANTLKVAQVVEGIYQKLGQDVVLQNLQDLPVECFSGEAYKEKPAQVTAMTDQILASNGLVVITPEYNGSMSGVLKHYIDLWPFPDAFENRPVCFIGISAGGSGAVRPIEHLQGIFSYRYAAQLPRRVFISDIFSQLDEAGGIKDADLVARLEKQATEFIDYVSKIRP
ncbi:MAG: NADPH-dependent FMN reductase [Verrucomicrobiota bacterium]